MPDVSFPGLLWAGAADGGKSEDNFVMAGGDTLTAGLTPKKLLQVALEENMLRMARYDLRLPRPEIMPSLARLALRFL